MREFKPGFGFSSFSEIAEEYNSGMYTKDVEVAMYDQFRKTANRRIRRIRESGYMLPYGAFEYLERIKRRQFPKLNVSTDQADLNGAIRAVSSFLDNERSTLTGIHRIEREVLPEVEERINEFRKDKVKFNINSANFYNFLHSKQFRRLRREIGSDIVLEDFNESLQEISADKIMEDYEKFITKEDKEKSFVDFFRNRREERLRRKNENN